MTERALEKQGFALPADDLVFNKPALNDVVAALDPAEAERKQSVSPTLVYGLSDLSPAGWQSAESAWRRLARSQQVPHAARLK